MKNKRFYVCLILSLAIVLTAPAILAASSAVATAGTVADAGNVSAADQDVGLVVDEAGVLTNNELATLSAEAMRITEEYECETRVMVIGSTSGRRMMNVASSLFTDNSFGYGRSSDCVMLLLSMEDRDYDLGAWGYAQTAFTEYGKDIILNQYILPRLRNDEYYEAFSAFLDRSEEYLQVARAGEPFDSRNPAERSGNSSASGGNYSSSNNGGITPAKLAVIVFFPLLIAALVCLYWRSKMKTAKIARTADRYIPDGGFALTRQEDLYLYRTQTRTKIERNNTSSGGGGGMSSMSSSGGSHRSGKF